MAGAEKYLSLGTAPALGWLAAYLLVGGTVLALVACACIIIPVRMATATAEDLARGHDR